MMKPLLTAACLLLLASPAAADSPVVSFHEQTLTAGIKSAYTGDWDFMVGGGAAAFDCNDDGYADLFLAGGASPARFYRNTSTHGGTITFLEETNGLGLERVTGAYPLDIDGDSKMDLVILRSGENVVMRGLGDCKFERANETWGFEGGDGWSTAFSATWEKGNGWPTLAVGNYIDRTQEISPWGSCTDNYLYRPAPGQKSFAAALPLTPSYCPLSILFTDWNRSGTPSLRVSNDREYYEGGQEQMWKINPGEPPQLYREDEGWKYLRIWGMGIADYDVNGDGYPDYYLTSMADQKLQTLAEIPKDGKPKPTYKDVAYALGVTAHRPYTGGDWHPSTGWHTQFEDVDNDGRIDIFVAKGNVWEMPDFAKNDPNNLMMGGADGKFHEMGDKAGVASFNTSRGAVLADFNLDGRLDLLVVNRWVNAELWRNTTRDAGHWIQVKLQQPGGNRNAIGAWLEVKLGDRIIRREITVGGGHVSGQAGWIHMGLGDTVTPEIRVLWPGGGEMPFTPVKPDSFLIVDRAANAVSAWQPK